MIFKKDVLDKLVLQGRKFSSREKFMPLAVITIIVLSIILFIGPIMNNIIKSNQRINDQRKELQVLGLKKNVLSSFQTGSNEITLNDQLLEVEQYLPSTKPALQVLINLSQLARLKGVNFSGVTLNPGKIENAPTGDDQKVVRNDTKQKSSDKTNSFDITFSVSGKKEDILDFITKLKEVSPLMKVDHFSISLNKSQNTDQGQAMMSSSLKVIVYYQEMSKTIPSVNTPINILSNEETAFLEGMKNYLFMDDRFKNSEKGMGGQQLGVPNPFATGSR